MKIHTHQNVCVTPVEPSRAVWRALIGPCGPLLCEGGASNSEKRSVERSFTRADDSRSCQSGGTSAKETLATLCEPSAASKGHGRHQGTVEKPPPCRLRLTASVRLVALGIRARHRARMAAWRDLCRQRRWQAAHCATGRGRGPPRCICAGSNPHGA
jgi:hypothetical protein